LIYAYFYVGRPHDQTVGGVVCCVVLKRAHLVAVAGSLACCLRNVNAPSVGIVVVLRVLERLFLEIWNQFLASVANLTRDVLNAVSCDVVALQVLHPGWLWDYVCLYWHIRVQPRWAIRVIWIDFIYCMGAHIYPGVRGASRDVQVLVP